MKPKHSLTAVLDIGTTKIVCFIARQVAGKLEVTGIGHQVSQGIRAGLITDVKQAESCILAAVDAAEKMAGETVDKVVVNISDPRFKSERVTVEVPLYGREVTERDLSRLLTLASEAQAQEDRKVIHCLPLEYALDGAGGITEPKGMFGKTLSAVFHTVSINASSLVNLANCLARCHLDISDYIFSPYASAFSCLSEDEKSLGVTLVEMGGGSTSVAAFRQGKLIFADMLPIGGGHVTQDIALGLNTPFASAERMKILYGNTLFTATDENKMIEMASVTGEEEGEGGNVSRAALVRVIRPRVEETLEIVHNRLHNSGVADIANNSLVFTGGASQMMGTKEIAADIFGRHIRFATPSAVEGLAESTKGAAFATSVGMLYYATRKRQSTPLDYDPKGYARKILHWVKENF